MFARAGQRLELKQCRTPDGVHLVVTPPGEPPRVHSFPDLPALTRFQSDMEHVLVWTGWSLVEFSPERRRGRDRRQWPRLEERRRWWTDATGVPANAGTTRTGTRRRDHRRD